MLRIAVVVALSLGLAAPAAATIELSFYGGMFAGGKLFKASADAPRNWPAPDGREILGQEIQTDLDEFIGGGARLLYRFAPQWSVAGGMGFSDMNIGSSVRRGSGSQTDSFSFDQALVLVGDLTVHYDLLPAGNRPYVLAGVGFASLDGNGDSFDQSGAGLSFGFGFRLRSIQGLKFDFEARDTVTSLDAGTEAARLGADEFSTSDRLHIWQLTANWVFEF